MKKRTKTILRITLLVLAAAVVGVNVYLLNAASIGGDAVPMPFGVGMTVVLTGSMEPELSAGDLLIVGREDSYSVNDVVVFQDGRTPVVHRIESIDGDTVVTRGDANNTSDDPIQLAQIKGRVIFAIPFVGHLVNIIKTPIGTLVIVAAAIFLLERSFRREKEKDGEELERLKEQIRELTELQKQQQQKQQDQDNEP